MTTSGSFVRRLIKTARAALRERDNLPSYPTLQRTVSDGRLGDFQVNYDDMRTINFSTSSVVRYPVMLRVDDPVYLNSTQAKEALGSIAVTGVGGGLTATGSITKGVSDALLADIPGSPYSQVDLSSLNYAPFNEDSISYAPRNDNEWWATGSIVLDVGEGFSSPVWSKTKIEIDLTSTEDCAIGGVEYSNNDSTVYSADQSLTVIPKNHLMAYYNFDLKKWEPIGIKASSSFGFDTSTPGGFQDITNLHNFYRDFIQNQCIGFSPGKGIYLTGTYSYARPTTTFGFPYNQKFHATGSQTLDLSQYIKHPFLFEKLVFEFEGEFTSSMMLRSSADPNTLSANQSPRPLRWETVRTTGGATTVVDPTALPYYAAINTFFILNQRKNQTLNLLEEVKTRELSRPSTGSITSSLPGPYVLSDSGSAIFVDTTRDLITYAQVTSFSGTLTPFKSAAAATELSIKDVLNKGLGRELNVDVSSEFVYPYPSGQGPWLNPASFSRRRLLLSGTVKAIPRNDAVPFVLLPAAINTTANPVPLIYKGNRKGLELAISSRDLNGASNAQFLLSDKFKDTSYGTVTDLVDVELGKYDVSSPYVLLPTDKLVFGWQAPLSRHPLGETSGSLSYAGVTARGWPNNIWKFFKGPAKITLYGSLLREGREYHEPLNQPLNTAALHEALHFDNPVIDQFEVATKYEYSGSYTDAKMSSTLSATADGAVAFSKSNATQKTGSYVVNESSSTELMPEYVYAGTQHVVEHTSNEERFYDSLIPDLMQLIKALNPEGSIRLLSNIIRIGILDGGTPLHRTFAYNNDVIRKSTLSKLFVATVDGVGDPIPPEEVSSLIIVDPSDTSYFWGDARNQEYTGSFDLYGLTPSDSIKVMLGVGDHYDKVVDDPFQSTDVNNVIAPRFVGLSGDGDPDPMLGIINPINTLISPQIRGWKYGLYSGFPTYTRCIFRRGRYGQPRDMLEQRYDSKFFFEKAGAAQAPIQVKFVNSLTNKATLPEQTWSSNLSFECTSSLPYFDGVVRNRLPIVLSSLNQNVINVSSDGNGNLTL